MSLLSMKVSLCWIVIAKMRPSRVPWPHSPTQGVIWQMLCVPLYPSIQASRFNVPLSVTMDRHRLALTGFQSPLWLSNLPSAGQERIPIAMAQKTVPSVILWERSLFTALRMQAKVSPHTPWKHSGTWFPSHQKELTPKTVGMVSFILKTIQRH